MAVDSPMMIRYWHYFAREEKIKARKAGAKKNY
jgi:hypothetical protein